MAEAPRFACDVMLGRLARWLRILGYDTVYGPHLRRLALLRCARREGRIVLTRDTRLLRDPELPPHVYVRHDRFRDQLRELAASVPLDAGGLLTRCLACNVPLGTVAGEEVGERVPAYVRATQPRFERCPRCGGIYWPATHRVRMVRELAALGLSPAGDAV